VSGIDLRGPAYRSGVRQGDLIMAVNGVNIDGKAAYKKAISSTAGTVARLYVRRGTKSLFFGLRRDVPLTAQVRSATR
jgi:S1-C subfamily serine protease